jgi:outer membrane protein OmpA-like peptidoglycan-associated protein
MKKLLIIFLLFAGYIMNAQNENVFGTKNTGLINLKGKIYYLSNEVNEMPADIETQKVEGTIYASKLDVPIRNFTEGFPGVTDRFEYFGIVYNGVFEISNAGEYKFRISSDDGSKLWIDNHLIINNDGVHGELSVEADTTLNKGLHQIEIWYFQGPATEIALQLFVKMPGAEEEEIFDLTKFNKSLQNAAKNLNATVTDEGIKIMLPNKILFDVGKNELKPESDESLNSLMVFLNMYPDATIQINGHSDATGNAADNIKLSEERANSVLLKLKSKNIPSGLNIVTKGYGDTKPIAKNTDENGRSQNRRVEIIIKP